MDLKIKIEGHTHECIQENRGNEIWMYCSVCKVYVRKFNSDLRPFKLIDTGFNHSGSINLDIQTNMN